MLADLWIEADDYYRILETWASLFHAEWKAWIKSA